MSESSTSVSSINQITYPNIYIAETGTNLGRGVYTSEDIPSGQIIETTPVVLLDLKSQPFPPQIRRLVYNWSKTHVALAFGFGSLYNHNDQPNLIFTRNNNDLSITFKALRNIETGEQLTISYDYLGSGENPRDRSWFEIHGVEKVVNEAGENGNHRGPRSPIRKSGTIRSQTTGRLDRFWTPRPLSY